MKTGEGNISLKAYCDRHTPREYKELVDVDKNIVAAQRWFANSKRKHNNRLPRRRYVDEEEEYELYIAQTQNKKKQRGRTAVNQLLPSSKAARAHQHEYSPGAPIAPEYIFKKIEDLNCVRQATKLRKKQQLITSICRYWSLKRESRRGTPLLKRLHLEVSCH
jgi:hypothetical protein